MMREGTTTQIVAADLAGARDDGGERQRRQRHVRHRRRRCRGGALTENLDRAVRPRRRRAAQPVVPGRGVGPPEDAHARPACMQQRTQPGFLAAETVQSKVVYGDHPAAASRRRRRRSTRSRATRWSSSTGRSYVPDHALIAFAGDITLADARKLVETKLGGVEEGGHAEADGDASRRAPGAAEGLPRRAARARCRRRCSSARSR